MTRSAQHIVVVLAHFAPHCRDTSTYRKLQNIAARPRRWRRGYALFESVRRKTLKAIDRRDEFLQHQYALEEICAKTLYNMSIAADEAPFMIPAPFDDDSADFVMPIARQFAAYLDISPPELPDDCADGSATGNDADV